MHTHILFLFLVALSYSQHTFSGAVSDNATGEPLVGVNIQLKGTLQGSATNHQGEFTISTDIQQPLFIVSFIGYQTQEISASEFMEIKLSEEPFSSETVMVYGEGLSEAQKLILSTIDRYNSAFSTVENVHLNAYSKAYFNWTKTKHEKYQDDSLRRIGKESEIRTPRSMFFESYKQIDWEKPNKIKQTILKRNQVADIPSMLNIFGVTNYQNVFEPIYNGHSSPLHRSHFDTYTYTIQDTVEYKNQPMILVTAKEKTEDHYWNYKLYITRDSHKITQVEGRMKAPQNQLLINIGGIIPMKGKHAGLLQEYQEINGMTFPQNMILNKITEHRVVRFTDVYSNHQVNTAEDIYFNEMAYEIDDTVDEFTLEDWKSYRYAPLSLLEKRAYVQGDSANQAKPFLKSFMTGYIKFIAFDYSLFGQRTTRLDDFYRFNPVEGHVLGLGLEFKKLRQKSLKTIVGYALGAKQVLADITYQMPLSYDHDIDIKLNPFIKITPIDNTNFYHGSIETMNTLIYHESKQNYFLNEGMELSFGKRFSKYLTTRLGVKAQWQSALQNHSEFSLFKKHLIYPENLQIDAGENHEINIGMAYNMTELINLGLFQIPKFVENGWVVNADAKFTEKLLFKSFQISGLKHFHLQKDVEFYLKSDLFVSGNQLKFQDYYFPRVHNIMDSNSEMFLSGYKPYEIASQNFYSLSGNLRFENVYYGKTLQLSVGTIAGAFTGRSASRSLQNVNLLNDKIEGQFSLYLDLQWSIPMRISFNYNTLNNINTTSYTVIQQQ